MSVQKKDSYASLGVSSSKEGVREATKHLSKGLYPGAFCKIVPLPKVLPEEIRRKYGLIIHADGVGTKSNVAYLSTKEMVGTHFLRKLAQDACVMNTDDLACIGITDEEIYISNHIGRNANRVSDSDLAEIIKGYSDYFALMKKYGVNLYDAGGETADVGSYVTTMGIDVTALAIIERSKVIDCSNIEPHQIIVGLSSAGKCIYETKENSGIRSNGLTLAINTLLHPYYRKYKEIMDDTIDEDNLLLGKYYLNDRLPNTNLTIAEAILSPTRSYIPVLKRAFEKGIEVSGIFHCSGGGMTKSVNFGKGIRYVKNDLFEVPVIFSEIQNIRQEPDEYMFKTFNMGTGMEVVVPTEEDAAKLISSAKQFNVDAKVIGYTQSTLETHNEVVIEHNQKTLTYKKGA